MLWKEILWLLSIWAKLLALKALLGRLVKEALKALLGRLVKEALKAPLAKTRLRLLSVSTSKVT
jgi:hypothetical protein